MKTLFPLLTITALMIFGTAGIANANCYYNRGFSNTGFKSSFKGSGFHQFHGGSSKKVFLKKGFVSNKGFSRSGFSRSKFGHGVSSRGFSRSGFSRGSVRSFQRGGFSRGSVRGRSSRGFSRRGR